MRYPQVVREIETNPHRSFKDIPERKKRHVLRIQLFTISLNCKCVRSLVNLIDKFGIVHIFYDAAFCFARLFSFVFQKYVW